MTARQVAERKQLSRLRAVERSAKSHENEVSTASGSDRVICSDNSTVAWIGTRSLPLAVLTAF